MRLRKLAVTVCASAALLVAGTGLTVPCPWDIDGDDMVGIQDFLIVLAEYGEGPSSSADFNHDRVVNIIDLLDLLSHWGPCP